MKALIAVTCVAPIAAVGYFFWNEYAEAKRAAAAQTRVDEAMSWLYQLSGAEKGDTRSVAQFCDNVRTFPEMLESARKLGADRACGIAGL